ncbi:efflux RND transporter periplasmic adaptor subunit [Cedecea neteri]|uniref:efflux RND transporter periplasmic adaptor subunit n=1 Tax=Cedecea neteri TaxID=158822 RepID=UPI002AA697FF|nr:efflux RND transporter periplasmic adaptor subunit [Cedecea neteri]WPU21943.1 efflux RND transporter periplasmic adaptor subunit [Cedecea neteri]
MLKTNRLGRLWLPLLIVLLLIAATINRLFFSPVVTATPPATATINADVATVTPRPVITWDEFSGHLDAVERVQIRSRVSGEIKAIHFQEGALVKQNDLLITIDPAPYQAAVAQTQADVAAAASRLAFARQFSARTRQLLPSGAISQNDVDQRNSEERAAQAVLQAAQAQLQTAQLNLSYTAIRAPVAGRIGMREITVGNLVEAGPNSPPLTQLVSVDPVYASFDADEQAVQRALGGLSQRNEVEKVEIDMQRPGESQHWKGHLQLIDNQVDSASGTLRLRAIFPNPNSDLTPGQFVRLRMGQARARDALVVEERAIGTDQDRRYVMVLDKENKASWRQITVGERVDGMRIVTSGLQSGDKVILTNLQRIRAGYPITPHEVSMGNPANTSAQQTSQ